MNAVFLVLVMAAFAVAAFRQLTLGPGDGLGDGTTDAPTPMEAVGTAMIEAASGAVELAIGLVGVMALFLGLMKVAEEGGLLRIVAKVLRPLIVRLFPEIPDGHPASGAIIMNLSANLLGLGNAATPFGIRAMQYLDQLNRHKGTATNAMVLFLAINTSSITLLPTGVIALRAAAGSADPAGIVPTTLFATLCSTCVAILAASFFAKRWPKPADSPLDGEAPENSSPENSSPENASSEDPSPEEAPLETVEESYPLWVSFSVLAGFLALIPLTIFHGRTLAPWIIPGLMVALLGFGAVKRVAVYECFVEGAKEGFQVALRIIPYLVAILVAVAMFRASGAMALILEPLALLTAPAGLPAEALPMALLRPLSGSGAYGILASIIQDPAIGPDSYTGYLVSTFQGSTETTFYVLAVYFGAVGVKRIRHALAAALLADATGIAAAVFIVGLLYG